MARFALPRMCALIPLLTCRRLFANLNLKVIEKRILFGAYDNLIQRFGWLGRLLRSLMQFLENTPLKVFGLSHFWVLQKSA